MNGGGVCACVGASWPAQARRRLAGVAASGFLAAFGFAAMDVAMPLWATRDLGVTAAEWAHLRSLRFAGVLVGGLALGAASDRFGQRRSTAALLLALGAVTVLLGLNSRLLLWVLMPVYGMLVSTIMVNLNTLTQAVSMTQPGVANAVYRGVGAAAGIVAPVAATSLAAWWGGYPAAFIAAGAVLAMAGCAMFGYPAHEPLSPLEHPIRELRRLWQGYAPAWRERPLMRFIHLSNLWNGALACVGAFGAIRLTRGLGLSDRAFGLLATVAGAVTLGAIVVAGWYLDRISLRRLHGVGGMIGAAGAVLMGVSDSVALTGVGFIVGSSCLVLLIAPSSMWVSRSAGLASQGAAFSVQKVLLALTLSLSILLFGLLERWIGMRLTLLTGGVIGVIAAGTFLRLAEPAPHAPTTPHTHERWSD